jgi:NAD(P)-dependent dehydrogenase (short-subunit alcohol dehydrogenase family)
VKRLEGRVAIVTGGGRGIGQAVAEGLAGEGASVVIGDISPERASQVAEGIRARGGAAIGRNADVSVRADVEALADTAESAFGVASVAFCSAGITTAGGEMGLLDLTDDEWQRVLDVNLRGTFLTSQTVARRMIAASGRGSIITVSSIGAQRPMFGAPAYHTTKAGVSGLTRALAINLAPYGIRANGLAPGYISTPMMLELLDAEREVAMLNRVPMRRLGDPQDLVGAVVFLASEESAYMTGQILAIDGGASILGWTPAEPLRFLAENGHES